MPLHLTSPLSVSRKSTPTCTLSLAHVSAYIFPPSGNAMQLDSTTLQLDLSTIHFVAVPQRTTRTKSSSTTTTHEINVIPFPTSTQTTSSSPTVPVSSKRQQVQKKQDSSVSLSVSPPRKRARKGNLSASPPTSSPSPRARALAQRMPPARPPTPTPDSRSDSAMVVADKSPPLPVQPSSPDPATIGHNHQQQTSHGEKGQDLENHRSHPELPPYSPSPPPYSPPVVAPMPISSPTPVPLDVPLSTSSSPPTPATTSSSAPPPLPIPPRPLPVSSPPPPPSTSPLPPLPQQQQRKSRISNSELQFFIFLYRTVVSGLEMRQQIRLNTPPVRRARDGSRREQHLDGVLVEMDDDDDDDLDLDLDIILDRHPKPDVMNNNNNNNNTKEASSPSLKEDLEVQDALLALRLRAFLKWNGVEEWMLKVDPSSSASSSPTTGMNPFPEEDDSNGSPDKMDVDVHHQEETTTPLPPPPPSQPPLPVFSSRHLITVLRMRGTCGSKQNGPIGSNFKRNNSKLRTCVYKAGGDDD